MTGRLRAFYTVGAAGFALQIIVVATLTSLFGWPILVATALGVEAAVLHNFFWHRRWTWRDRAGSGAGRVRQLLRFHLTTGITSIAGNLVLVSLAVQLLGANGAMANVLAVGAMSLVNYLIADRFVFARIRTTTAVTALTLAGLAVLPRPAAAADLVPEALAADLGPETLAAWTAYVAAAEAGIVTAPGFGGTAESSGRETKVDGGLIHEWRGRVVIPGITVAQLVEALTNPGTPPPQEDVVASRVLARDGDRLRVYLKVVRSAIITVTYDTEHDVRFVRHSGQYATSRSEAMTITELGGSDHGFLWRLNSYWQYRQTDAGVQVDVLSLSLSRGVPLLLRPVAGPIVNRIARESMTRTLDAVRRFGEALPRSSVAATKAPAPGR